MSDTPQLKHEYGRIDKDYAMALAIPNTAAPPATRHHTRPANPAINSTYLPSTTKH